MIFLIWFFAWIALAQQPLQLAVPAFALVIRFAYVQRSFPRFPALVLLVWLMLAGFTAAYEGLEDGVRIFAMALLSTVCIFHYVSRVKASRFLRGKWIGRWWFFLTRALVIVGDRTRDIRRWLGLRVRARGKSPFLGYLRLLPQAGLALLVETLSLRRRVAAVVQSRGGFPDTLAWVQHVEGSHAWIFVLVGDILVVGASIAISVVADVKYIPNFVALNLHRL